MKIVFTFIVYVILPIVLALNFINQFYFPFFFLIDHGNEYDTIRQDNFFKNHNIHIDHANAEYLSHERWLRK